VFVDLSLDDDDDDDNNADGECGGRKPAVFVDLSLDDDDDERSGDGLAGLSGCDDDATLPIGARSRRTARAAVSEARDVVKRTSPRRNERAATATEAASPLRGVGRHDQQTLHKRLASAASQAAAIYQSGARLDLEGMRLGRKRPRTSQDDESEDEEEYDEGEGDKSDGEDEDNGEKEKEKEKEKEMEMEKEEIEADNDISKEGVEVIEAHDLPFWAAQAYAMDPDIKRLLALWERVPAGDQEHSGGEGAQIQG
jgi:hypothetical protein